MQNQEPNQESNLPKEAEIWANNGVQMTMLPTTNAKISPPTEGGETSEKEAVTEAVTEEPVLESALIPEPQQLKSVSEDYEILMAKNFWDTVKTEMPQFGLPEAIEPTDFINFLVVNRDRMKAVPLGNLLYDSNQNFHNTPIAVGNYPTWKIRLALFFMFLGIATAGWFVGKKARAIWLKNKK